MRGYDGTEFDFEEELVSVIPNISKEKAGRLVRIMEKAAYGNEKPNIMEEDFIRRLYFDTASYVYHTLSYPKKWVLRYMKRLI